MKLMRPIIKVAIKPLLVIMLSFMTTAFICSDVTRDNSDDYVNYKGARVFSVSPSDGATGTGLDAVVSVSFDRSDTTVSWHQRHAA